MIRERIAKVRTILVETGLDAVYLTAPVTHRYFAGYDNPDGSLLITQKNAYLFADFRYIEAARERDGDVYTVLMPEKPRREYLPALLRENRAERLGIEDHFVSCAAFERLKDDLGGMGLVGIGDRVEKLRQVKTAEEIAAIVRAQRIAERALSSLLDNFSYEMTENDIAAELEFRMRKAGAEDKSFETIAISGEATSRPHGVPQNRKVRRGFLTMDFGATVDGYHSDMTRTVCVGKADAEMKKLYETVLAAQNAALAVIVAGKTGRECDHAARDIIERDYAGCFGHSLGHSVGLQIHESPNLSPRSEEVLAAGNVVTVEPGIYVAGKYGCRIEDMVAVTADGCENLTNFPKNLIEL